MPPIEILYEDNHIIIVNKKPSDIVQGDKTGDKPLSEFVKDYLREKYNKPGNIFVGVVHRLDRPVSGLVVFAKTSKALSRMNDLFRNKNVTKLYWAVTRNEPKEISGHLKHYLKRNEAKNISTVSNKESSESKLAELKYTVISQVEGYYLLEVELLTGRHHQIRAQLSAMGCPIVGDNKYGYPRSHKDGSINLHARYIEFIHPVSKEKIEVVAPLNIDPVWKKFQFIEKQ